jgi:pyruvate dehydrogenase E2 component (dihydrolipoyllysine-residue acetyltransferase)
VAEVIMPKMGDAMEEGTLLKWLKSEGDEVEEGEPIAEIETDKASMEIEAEDSGTLHEIIVQEGQDVPVGEAIAVILGEDEEPPDRDGAGEVEAEEEAETEESTEAQAQTATETEEEEAPETEEEPAATAQPEGRADGQVRASPIVRRLAHENNLDLSQIEGSGPQGRIVERDVRAAIESGVAQADGKAETEAPEAPTEEQPQEAPQAIWQPPQLPEPTGAPGTEVQEPTRMQQIIGERMTAAWQQAPHFYATVEVQMDEAMALRAQLNEKLAEEEIKLSINDLVMKACASALKDFPKLNSLYTSEGIELHEKVDMAMAVALEEGLITPVIRDCANKGLSAISRESKELAKRAHEGDLTPEEYQGGSITVSNMGMFGVESFSAIINPPQAAIVAVSSIIKRPTYNEDGEVVPANFMKLTLSADHRIANGADGAHYMATVKRLLENPMLLLV